MRSRFPGFTLVICLVSIHPLATQTWLPVDDQLIQVTGARDIVPTTCQTYQTDDAAIKDILWSAPIEYAENVANSTTLLTVGLADGTADIFRMVKYDMMEALLAASYPHIKTFRGISISNPYRRIRADYTEEGFRATIHDQHGTTYIDPFQRNDLAHRIVYFKENLTRDAAWDCGVEEPEIDGDEIYHNRLVGDCDFRSYRLAVATTGEYSNFFGATSPAQSGLVLSQVVTAINRVNEVYEADLTVRLILIGNNADVFYYDPAGDPFSGSACTQLGQNQSNMDAVIGSANYDVGHVFSVGSGGCAGLGVICSSTGKARGATGLSPPVGDPFYIDYVAHEIGHQFGGDHTFNGTANSCNGNRVGASAYEPGSGSTIMAYAGICGAQDLQPNSDDYFHARSLLQIANKLANTSCATFITFTNEAPVAASTPNYTIPVSTPFVLTADVTDPDGDSLSYCWEQYDLESTSSEPPAANDGDGPMFRSFQATTSPSRYFPRLEDLTANINPMWEVLPSVSRAMNFKMTARDYHALAGCTDEDDVIVTTSTTSGPFVVTSQNSATIWSEGITETITWNVANTTAAPVSCANVEIRLSTDGGYTYPTVLAANETNDGSASIVVPIGTTTMGRVMVKGASNIFFDINNANITINAALPNFTLTLNPGSVTECNDGAVQTTVEVGQFMGYMDPVTLSILTLPPGAIAVFNPQVVVPGATSTLTISNLMGLFGAYTPTVRGTSTSGVKDVLFPITLLSTPTTAPTLTSPANNTTDAVITPLLDWQPVSNILQYEFQLAFDASFSMMAVSGTATSDQFQITSPLVVEEQYFWRVRAINSCGVSAWSSTFNFTTVSCFALNSTNVPVIIPETGAPTVFSTFTNDIEMIIQDVNVINLLGAHSWVDDLKFSLISPDGTERLFWNQPCANHDNFHIQFDDEAGGGNWPCPPTNGMTYRPDNTLSVFDGEQAMGNWMLKIQDIADQDGGSLNGWGLKVCGEISCQLVVNQLTGTGTGSLPAAINCAMAGDTVWLSAQLAGQTIQIGDFPIFLNKDLVIQSLAPNITIATTGTRIFEVVPGTQVQLVGMVIVAGSATDGGAIKNQGILHLRDMTIEKNGLVNGAILIGNVPGGTLQIEGNCSINQ